MTYKNFAGAIMPTSTTSTKSQWGNGKDDTLVGGGVDDTFFIYSPLETVVEPAGAMATIDIETWFPYTLAANVKNMIVEGNPGSATGNALDNLIVAQGSVSMTIDGGTGNDVMVANTGIDTFVFDGNSGHDVIYAFDPSKDILRLSGTVAGTFPALQSRMEQKGQDVVLTLSASTSVTLRNTTLNQLTAKDFAPVLDTSKLKLSFDDEFNTFTSSPDGSTGWKTSYHGDGRTYSNNHEAEYYSDTSTGVDPFSDHNGILTITAAPASAGQTPSGSGLSYTSGVITTEKSFSQLYGYFEVRAQLPAGNGFWPAFWMLPADNSWPPEIDVMEQVGGNTTYQTSHSNDGGFNTQQQFSTQVAGNSTGFHTYGVDWEADKITWYVDGVGVASTATPSDMHKPMYMLLNLAVGATGSWPGAADGKTAGELKVDYIRAYASMADTIASPTVAIKAQTLASDTGASATDRITRNGRITLSGTVTGASGTKVTVYDGSLNLGAATLGVNSAWTYTTTLTSGTHALHALATDPTGHTASTVTAASITVQTAAPVAAITTQVAHGLTTTLTGTVSATGIAVTLFNGSTKVGDATLDGRGSWTFSSKFEPGSYHLSAFATDLAGNQASVAQSYGFTVVAAPAALDTLVLSMSEDAYKGDAEFSVSVDGKQVGGTQLVTTLHGSGKTQTFELTGRFGVGTHDVAVNFLNDAYAGTRTTDRNLYVGSIGFNGRTTTENANQNRAGTHHYQVSSPSLAGSSGNILTVASGTTLVLDDTAGTNATVTFTGSDSVAQFSAAPDFHGSINGFSSGDVLDLRSILSSQASPAPLFYTDAGTSGLLHVSDGTHSSALALVGAYASGHFAAASDTFGGTAVSWVHNLA